MKKYLNKKSTEIFLSLIEILKVEKTDAIKIDNTNGSYMPVSFEKIEDIEEYQCYSLAHYGKQNGDLMADPEMCFLVAQNEKNIIVIPYSFRNDYVGVDRMDLRVDNGKITGIRNAAIIDNIKFANMWLVNIKNQQNI